MKLLNIALLLILSLNAFAGTPVEEVASPEASSSKILSQIFKFSQTSPTTHKVFLVSKLAQAALSLRDWNAQNKKAFQKHLSKKKLPSMFEGTPLPYKDLLRQASAYISQHLFALHVDAKIHPKSQPSAEHKYMRLAKFGALIASHGYNLWHDWGRMYRINITERTGTAQGGINQISSIAQFAYRVANAWLQYKTIRALEDPKNHKVPTVAKYAQNTAFFLQITSLIYRPITTCNITVSKAIQLFDLCTQTLFINQLVTAAERHIATQQPQA